MKNDPRICELNLCNCVRSLKKFRTSTGFEPVTSRYRCDALTNWAMKPLMLGASQLCVFMFPWWDECDRCIWNKWYKNCGNKIKWRLILAVVLWMQFMQLRKKPGEVDKIVNLSLFSFLTLLKIHTRLTFTKTKICYRNITQRKYWQKNHYTTEPLTATWRRYWKNLVVNNFNEDVIRS